MEQSALLGYLVIGAVVAGLVRRFDRTRRRNPNKVALQAVWAIAVLSILLQAPPLERDALQKVIAYHVASALLITPVFLALAWRTARLRAKSAQ